MIDQPESSEGNISSSQDRANQDSPGASHFRENSQIARRPLR